MCRASVPPFQSPRVRWLIGMKAFSLERIFALFVFCFVPSSGREQAATGLTYRYNICNGLSNQLLYHAGSIATAVERKYQQVDIPDHFIVNGVQNSDANVLPDQFNSIPFGDVFDKDHFLEKVQELGIRARLVSLDFRKPQQACAGMQSLTTADPSDVLHIMQAFRPSKPVQKLVDRVLDSFQNLSLENGVCLHHRDGRDWYKHCSRWESIDDGVYRGNCRPLPGRDFLELLKERGLASEGRSWIYYCGDHKIPKDLKESGYSVFSRSDLLSSDDLRLPETKLFSGRDIWALVDFFVCRSFHLFIGNSVSTFSAVQIALRSGHGAYWYNSQSIPLGGIWKAFWIPIVYTYTELSKSSGQHLLQTSIMSVRQHMPRSKIHVIYHGKEDVSFRNWLKEQDVIIHDHDPKWRDSIEKMRKNGDPKTSHLFSHSGNYFGTWQRIDIPQFIDSEYCLLLDSDTTIARPFTMADFGAKITYGLAMSTEMIKGDNFPANAGVTLFNVPYLRQTYAKFLDFILDHVDNPVFDNPSPSDQGAYLDYYRESTQFLSNRFNYKPYWPPPDNERDYPFIIHFHGAKPHDYFKFIFGNNCERAIQFLCKQVAKRNFLCPSFQSFARASKSVDPLSYCNSAFVDTSEALFCNSIFDALSSSEGQCSNLGDVVRGVMDRFPSKFSLPRRIIEHRLSATPTLGNLGCFLVFCVVVVWAVLMTAIFRFKGTKTITLISSLLIVWACLTLYVAIYMLPDDTDPLPFGT